MSTEVAAVIQGLGCSLCFNLLEEPKLLSCTHSFCEKCLERLYNFERARGKVNELSCPLCQQVTRLGSIGLSDLKTNVPLKSLVGDVKTSRMMCTVCDPEARSSALNYCQQCDEYICDACLKGHGRFKKNASHVVVSMDDIKSGKVKVKQMCHKHQGEERLWVCTSCKVSVCFRCRMLDHNGSDHRVQEVEDFKKNMKDEIKSLQKRGVEKMEKIKSYTKVVKEETARVEAIIAEREADINKAFEETLLQLNAKKNALLHQCKEMKRKLTEEICRYGNNGDERINSLNSACELVGNGVGALLEGEALVVHSNLCRELQDMLDREDPDEAKLKQIIIRAEGLTFTRCILDDKHNLGILSITDWVLEKVAELSISTKKPRSMAPTKYGKMLVGYDDGIEEFTVSGLHKTVLKDVNVWCVSVLSDGRNVVRDYDGKISLYSSVGSDLMKLHSKDFEIQPGFRCGGMDVDECNNIYVGNYCAETIRVFTPEGGAPIREIPCQWYCPFEICTMNHSNMLVVRDGFTVRVVDQQGTVKHEVTKYGFFARPAVLHDDSILIGWKKNDLVSIDLYTNQLRHLRTVISGLEFDDYFWALREFSSGEIALCTNSKFFVVRKS